MDNITRVYKKTRLRNLKRSYAKMIQHSELIDECSHIQCEIHNLEKELSS